MLTEEEKLVYSALSSKIEELRDLCEGHQKKREDLISDVLRRSILSGSWVLKEDYLEARLRPADNKTEREIHKLLRETFKLSWHDSVIVPFEGFVLHVRVDDGDVRLNIEIRDGSDFSTFKKNGVRVEEESLAEYFCSELENELRNKECRLEDLQKSILDTRGRIESLKGLIKRDLSE